jgi:hypothetical protein
VILWAAVSGSVSRPGAIAPCGRPTTRRRRPTTGRKLLTTRRKRPPAGRLAAQLSCLSGVIGLKTVELGIVTFAASKKLPPGAGFWI